MKSDTRYTHVHWSEIQDGVLNPNVHVFGGGSPRLGKWVVCPLWNAKALRGPGRSRPEFRKALCDSIVKEGVRNPVLCAQLGGKLYIRYGASRVVECRNAEDATGVRIRIPVIISSIGDAVKRGGILVTKENLDTFFKDPPLWVNWEEDGYLNYGKCFSSWDASYGNIGYMKEAEVMRDAIAKREAGVTNPGLPCK